MSNATAFVSRYDQRVALVQDVVTKNTTLDERTCRAVAVRVLHALDSIPEKMR